MVSLNIRRIVADVEYIANLTKLLALKASLEVARSGVDRKAFAVVSDEVRKLFDRSDSTAEDIRELLIRTEADIDCLCAVRSPDVGEIVNDTLKKIICSMSRAQSRLDELETQTGELARDLSGILVSRQFQDVSQRIEHIIGPLLSFRSEMEDMAGKIGIIDEKTHEYGRKDTAWLENMYAMGPGRRTTEHSSLSISMSCPVSSAPRM